MLTRTKQLKHTVEDPYWGTRTVENLGVAEVCQLLPSLEMNLVQVHNTDDMTICIHKDMEVMHSQKKMLKLGGLSTYTEIFVFST